MKAIWLLIGIIVGLVVLVGLGYAGIKFYIHSNNQITLTPPTTSTQLMKTQPTIIASNDVYKVMPSGKLGPIFTDTKGMTLYTFKNDTPGVSHCLAGCLKAWPAYVATSQNGNFPANISVIKRSDGILQYAWKNMPLYYFENDKHAGDVNGEGIGNVWFVVKQTN